VDDRERAAREKLREWGKKGGRPRSVVHREDGKYCRCAECRAGREERKGAVVTAKGGAVGDLRGRMRYVPLEGE